VGPWKVIFGQNATKDDGESSVVAKCQLKDVRLFTRGFNVEVGRIELKSNEFCLLLGALRLGRSKSGMMCVESLLRGGQAMASKRLNAVTNYANDRGIYFHLDGQGGTDDDIYFVAYPTRRTSVRVLANFEKRLRASEPGYTVHIRWQDLWKASR